MRRVSIVMLLGVAAVAATSFFAGRWTGPATRGTLSTTPLAGSDGAASASRKVLYWHDPMVPAQRFDHPGRSPFMDMQLVPVYAGAASESGTGGLALGPGVRQNLGLRTTKVRRADVSSSFDAVGTVQFDERRSVSVQTRVAGYVERLAVRAPMERVRKGQPLATVYAPDWLAPQNELLALQRSGVSPDIVAAARARLDALSIPQELVRRSEAAGIAQARYTLTAPMDGVVAELGVREGVAVGPGATLFRIAGLATVWAVADIPESQVPNLVRGQKVSASLQADAGRTFDGVLTEIVPEIDPTTRTLKARFNVDNRGGALVPGMLLRLALHGPTATRLVVASEAVIRTGTRTVVIALAPDGTYAPRAVMLGAASGDDVEVTQGLQEGDEVVASGQFLIDSEAQLRSALGNLSAAGSASSPSPAAVPDAPPPTASSSAAMTVHVGEGRVEQITPLAITLSHGPIASLHWPAMTMGFGKPNAGAYADIHVGDRVRFTFTAGGPSGYVLAGVQKLAVSAPEEGAAR